ncbi:MAG: hypothetical protein WD048_12555 [Chitinophagales bacterium]
MQRSKLCFMDFKYQKTAIFFPEIPQNSPLFHQYFQSNPTVFRYSEQ